MNATTLRLILLCLAVLTVFGVAYALRGTLAPSAAQLPNWSFRDMPLEFGDWSGEQTELKPGDVMFEAIDADAVVNHVYRNTSGTPLSVHTAMFTGYSYGVQHNPLVCYESTGWKMVASSDLDLDVGEEKTIAVRLVTWELENRRVKILYWYQLGDSILFDRPGLGAARLPLIGKSKWPAMIKVLMETPASDGADARLKEAGEFVYRWANAPGRGPMAGFDAEEPAQSDPPAQPDASSETM